MPLYEYECCVCGERFEFLKIRSDEWCYECKVCRSPDIKQVISVSGFRMDADSVLKSLPDPVPPLKELIGRQREGTEGGFKELENEQRQLKDYTRRKDRQGNIVWLPKERVHMDMGKRDK